MLQVYEYVSHIEINGSEYGSQRFYLVEEEHSQNRLNILDTNNYSEFYNFINTEGFPLLKVGQTVFKEPCIIDDWYGKKFKNKSNFSCHLYYKIKKSDASLSELSKTLKSEYFLMYLKDRGFRVCPFDDKNSD